MEYKFLDRQSFQKYMKEFGELYTLCFGVPMDEQEVKWRYLENPRKEILACIALDGDRLVANYSASPIQLIRNGEIVKVAQSLNTMTHPDYIGKGLFVKLAQTVYSYMAKNGYKMVMGFPNNISNRTFLSKLNWRDICVVPTLEINLETVRKKNLDLEVTVCEDSKFDLDYSKCIQQDKKIISVYKPKEYLKWRYAQCPSVEYYNFVILSEMGYVSSRIILKEFRNRINIVDAYFKNVDEEKALLNYSIDFGRSRGKSLLTMWAKLGSQEHLAIESYGAILASPISYFGGCVFDSSDIYGDFYEADNWFLNMSDDNVY